jgi:hypothetical protein
VYLWFELTRHHVSTGILNSPDRIALFSTSAYLQILT